MIQKVREGKHQHISHHGLIHLMLMDALSHLRNQVLWIDFVDITREIFIETQAITHEETPTSCIAGIEGKKKEEEVAEIEEEEEEEETEEGEGEKQGTEKENPRGAFKPQDIGK